MSPTTASERLRLIRSLFPGLAAELDGAYERFGTDGGELASARDLDAWLDGEAARLRSDTLAHALFPGASADAAQRLGRAFGLARAAADLLGTEVPEPETFAAAGVHFSRLGEHLDADPTLLAVPAPYGFGAEPWRAAFRLAAARHPEGLSVSDAHPDPLLLSTEATEEFARLDAPPGATLAVVRSDRMLSVGVSSDGVSSDGAGSRVQWTLRLVPGADKPSVLGLGHTHGPHVSLPEILMLQLMRTEAGESPIDASSFTWLAGTLADGRLAARHVFDEREGVIRISCREVGNQGPHLGARPPIA